MASTQDFLDMQEKIDELKESLLSIHNNLLECDGNLPETKDKVETELGIHRVLLTARFMGRDLLLLRSSPDREVLLKDVAAVMKEAHTMAQFIETKIAMELEKTDAILFRMMRR